METDGSFLESLKELMQPSLVTAGQKNYSTAQLFNLPLPVEPAFPGITLVTLDSLVEYVTANKDKVAVADTQIVCTAEVATMYSPPWGENRQRDILASVHCARRGLKLNGYIDLETFRLQLLTQYIESPEMRSVLKFVSSISDSNVVTSEDDGKTQSVTAKIGVASHGQVEIPSPVTLQPIRTFEEISQPEGLFVFRMKKMDKGLPEAGLFEIDTNWQRAAAIAAAAYLKEKLPEMVVLA